MKSARVLFLALMNTAPQPTSKMKRTTLTLLIAAVAVVACIAGLTWHYRATAERPLTIIDIPTWMAGSQARRYSLAVGKSQIKPYGTLWETTVGAGYVSNFPHYTAAESAAYLKRHR